MAKFKCEFSDSSGGYFSSSAGFSELSSEDMLTVLRPAAEVLKNAYIATINRLFRRRSGSFAGSIKASEFGLDREYMDSSEASITVAPTGKHKGGKRGARSRAGAANKKYAKHNRDAKATSISNSELGYLFEYGTPRMPATHWMENTNEEVEEEVQQIIEDNFDKLLKSKGLI